ncbi:hypothetical protein FRC02_003725 [Tulasnella sp. 418]|nr:hypothetical protein FRC02_003725 [Tulasnella sp. 418]
MTESPVANRDSNTLNLFQITNGVEQCHIAVCSLDDDFGDDNAHFPSSMTFPPNPAKIISSECSLREYYELASSPSRFPCFSLLKPCTSSIRVSHSPFLPIIYLLYA